MQSCPYSYLFVEFFIKAYFKRSKAEKEKGALEQTPIRRIARSGSDAAAGVEREVRRAMGDAQGYNGDIRGSAIADDGEIYDEMKKIVKDGAHELKKNVHDGAEKLRKEFGDRASAVSREAERGTRKAAEQAKNLKKEFGDRASAVSREAERLGEGTRKTAEQALDSVKQKADQVGQTKSEDEQMPGSYNGETEKAAKNEQGGDNGQEEKDIKRDDEQEKLIPQGSVQQPGQGLQDKIEEAMNSAGGNDEKDQKEEGDADRLGSGKF
jgi:hypothetical protein